MALGAAAGATTPQYPNVRASGGISLPVPNFWTPPSTVPYVPR